LHHHFSFQLSVCRSIFLRHKITKDAEDTARLERQRLENIAITKIQAMHRGIVSRSNKQLKYLGGKSCYIQVFGKNKSVKNLVYFLNLHRTLLTQRQAAALEEAAARVIFCFCFSIS
jgi:predicted YcjX-like family ATPase